MNWLREQTDLARSFVKGFEGGRKALALLNKAGHSENPTRRLHCFLAALVAEGLITEEEAASVPKTCPPHPPTVERLRKSAEVAAVLEAEVQRAMTHVSPADRSKAGALYADAVGDFGRNKHSVEKWIRKLILAKLLPVGWALKMLRPNYQNKQIDPRTEDK